MMLLILHVTCSCIFHAYILFIFSYFKLVFCSLSLSLSRIDCAIAPKPHKSIPAQSPFCGSGSSSSDSPVPSHIRIHDEKAKTDLFENFQNRGVHLERQVILSDFSNTALPEVIQTRGWESLCGKPERCPVVFILEFYSNMHDIDTSVPRLVTTFRDTRGVVTLNLISEVLPFLK